MSEIEKVVVTKKIKTFLESEPEVLDEKVNDFVITLDGVYKTLTQQIALSGINGKVGVMLFYIETNIPADQIQKMAEEERRKTQEESIKLAEEIREKAKKDQKERESKELKGE